MTDGDDLTSAWPLATWSHPATMAPGERRPAAYQPPTELPPATAHGDATVAPWVPHARFAPPGPSHATLSAPGVRMVLGAPTLGLALLPVPEPPDASLDESAVLERIADIADPHAPAPYEDEDPEAFEADRTPAIEDHPPPLALEEPATAYWAEPIDDAVGHDAPHEDPGPLPPNHGYLPATEWPADDLPPPPEPVSAGPHADTHPPAPTPADEATEEAYWATLPDLAQDAPPDSLAWASPGKPDSVRSTPAMAGLWAAEPMDGQDIGAPPQRRTGRPVAKIAAGLAVLVAAGIATILILPRLLAPGIVPVATFNAPMMVLRAAGIGRVASVPVTNGQTVEPSTLLMTIHTDPQPDPAASLLQDRLEAARSRLAALDDALAQPGPNTDAGRARTADLRRQRAAAATDIAQLQDGIANIPARLPADQPVRAGIHGVIRSMEAQAGSMTATGVPLVRMLDCDHAFLTLPPDSKLRVGEVVRVKLPNLPTVAATVRKSSGIAEPPDSLVIAPSPGAFVQILSGSCPVGATATVMPAITGS